jgi:hypothetical protein
VIPRGPSEFGARSDRPDGQLCLRIEKGYSLEENVSRGLDRPTLLIEGVRPPPISVTVRRFHSATSVAPSTPYRVGMTIRVLYDPDDVIPPMIDSWQTIWGGHIAFLFAGLVFLGFVTIIVSAAILAQVVCI